MESILFVYLAKEWDKAIKKEFGGTGGREKSSPRRGPTVEGPSLQGWGDNKGDPWIRG